MKNKIDYENESVPKLFFKLAVPTVFSMIVSAFYIIIDGIFVGKGVGGEGLAAVNIVVPLFTVFTGIGLMTGIGTSVHSAIELSVERREKSNRFFTFGILIILAIMIPISIIMTLFDDNIVKLLGANQVILALSQEYMQNMMYYSLFFTLSVFLPFYIRLDRAPNLAMVATITGALLNILLDYLFIFPMDMGVKGAALATGIGNILSTAIMLFYIFKKSKFLSFIKPNLMGSEIISVIKIGFSALLTELGISFSVIVINITLIKGYGDEAVTAYSIINYIHPLLMLIFMGLAQSIQPIASFNFGINNRKRTRDVLKVGLTSALIVGVLAVIIGFVANELIISLFLDRSYRAFSIAANGLPLFFINYLFLGLNNVMTAYFQSVTEAKKATLLTVLRGFILLFVSVSILPVFLGINGIWISVTLAEMIGLIVAFYMLNCRNDKISNITLKVNSGNFI